MIEMIEKEYESNVSNISITSSTFETKNLELVKEMRDRVKRFDEEKKLFKIKISKLEKLLTQRVKDFDDVKIELSRRIDKFEIGTSKRDNVRLSGTLGVERQRVDRLRRSMSINEDHEEHFKLILELLKKEIHEARVEALKKENVKDENLHGMDKEFENCLVGTLCIMRRSWLPRFHQWPDMEAGITTHVNKCLTCLRTRDDYQRPYGLLPAKDNKLLRHDLGNRGHQRNYVDMKRKPLGFQAGGRFHSTFHISNLKKYLSDETLAIPLDEIQIDDKLHFIKESVEIIDREREDQMLKSIHIFFANPTSNPTPSALRTKLF
ncbi:hypothetical protein Tco_0817531 [Tanacetum coccineum]